MPVTLFSGMLPSANLQCELSEIAQIVAEQKITCLVINSWEFAHKSYIYKERAIFELMGLLNSLDITILIYSQAKPAEPGKIQRGGLGKLSALADEIISIDSDDETDTLSPPAEPENEKLEPLKINELSYARSQSGVSAEGELTGVKIKPKTNGHDSLTLSKRRELVEA
jgi:hypothetical protein